MSKPYVSSNPLSTDTTEKGEEVERCCKRRMEDRFHLPLGSGQSHQDTAAASADLMAQTSSCCHSQEHWFVRSEREKSLYCPPSKPGLVCILLFEDKLLIVAHHTPSTPAHCHHKRFQESDMNCFSSPHSLAVHTNLLCLGSLPCPHCTTTHSDTYSLVAFSYLLCSTPFSCLQCMVMHSSPHCLAVYPGRNAWPRSLACSAEPVSG